MYRGKSITISTRYRQRGRAMKLQRPELSQFFRKSEHLGTEYRQSMAGSNNCGLGDTVKVRG